MVDRHLILDGYNLFHRARGGFQKGDWPVVFNFFRGLRPIVERFLPLQDVTLVLEGTPKRQELLLPEYKANRGPAPDGFQRQVEAIVEILGLMPINVIQHPDYEADDVINTLICAMPGFDDERMEWSEVVVVSSDSDFTQLKQRSHDAPGATVVDVWNWRDDEFLQRPDFDYVHWKALRGDPTDNIPRCPGMTEAVAMAVAKDATRFELLMNDAAFKGAYERNVELIRLKDLGDEGWAGMWIRDGRYRDPPERVPVEGELKVLYPSGIEVTRPTPPDWDAVKERFESFGFRSMLRDSTWKKWCETFESIGRAG